MRVVTAAAAGPQRPPLLEAAAAAAAHRPFRKAGTERKEKDSERKGNQVERLCVCNAHLKGTLQQQVRNKIALEQARGGSCLKAISPSTPFFFGIFLQVM